MKWNERTTDCLEILRTRTRPACRNHESDFSAHPDFPVPRALIRDLLFGPKVLAELAILRRIAD